MKTRLNVRTHKHASGFTLIEMIGVLAVIAILAAVLIPKVFVAINNSRVNNAAISCNTVKAAVIDHYAKYNALNVSDTGALTVPATGYTAYDDLLLTEGFLEKPFIVKIGTTSDVLLAGGDASTADPASVPEAFNLDGASPLNDAAGTYVVYAEIYGVTSNDAKDLNDRIDGTTLGTALGSADSVGRVKFAGTFPATVRVYLTHR